MAITGLMMIVFLLAHMFGNLKVFSGAADYNHYGEWLHGQSADGGILSPILPSGWFVWILRIGLIVVVILHIYSALKVWQASLRGRGAKAGKKYTRVTRPERSLSAKFMRWGGLTLLLLLVVHLLMFTSGVLTFDAYQAQQTLFQKFTATFAPEYWYIYVVYVLFVVIVGMHIRHGFYSSFTTLGANVSERAASILNGLAYFVAALLVVGFLLPPTASILGYLGG